MSVQSAIALLLLGSLLGCATPPPASDPDALTEFRDTNDPMEPTNRAVHAMNDTLDAAILRPVSKAYVAVLPAAVRGGIHNLLSNLGAPVRLINDMQEGKPRRAGDTTMRFLINSTVGLLGVFDVAARWGYPDHKADFGLTLATWGVPDGPYVVLPLLGPSGARDAVGSAVTIAEDPLVWVGQGTAVTALAASRVAVSAVDERARHGDDIDNVRRTSLEPYAAFRSLYRQSRRSAAREIENDRRATVPIWFPQPAPR